MMLAHDASLFWRTFMSPLSNRVGIEPLVVSPREACVLLNIGNTRLYHLISTKQIDSYNEGRARRIPMASIKAYLARCLAESTGKRGRGRPRKIDARIRPTASQEVTP
jgi:excisionase family DNA binding protein